MYEKYCGFSTKYCAHTNLIAERYVGVKKIIAVYTKVHIVWILQKKLCVNKINCWKMCTPKKFFFVTQIAPFPHWQLQVFKKVNYVLTFFCVWYFTCPVLHSDLSPKFLSSQSPPLATMLDMLYKGLSVQQTEGGLLVTANLSTYSGIAGLMGVMGVGNLFIINKFL